MSATLTIVWMTDSQEKSKKRRGGSLQLNILYNSTVTFTIDWSPECNGVQCLQRGHSGTRLLLLIIVVHC